MYLKYFFNLIFGFIYLYVITKLSQNITLNHANRNVNWNDNLIVGYLIITSLIYISLIQNYNIKKLDLSVKNRYKSIILKLRTIIYNFTTYVVPLFIITLIVFNYSINLSLERLIIFIFLYFVSIAFHYLLNFFYSTPFNFFNKLFYLLFLTMSGLFVPIDFFSQNIYNILSWTPFPYLFYYPASIFIGIPLHFSYPELIIRLIVVFSMTISLFWIISSSILQDLINFTKNNSLWKFKEKYKIILGLLALIIITLNLYLPTLYTGFIHDDWGDLGNVDGESLEHMIHRFSPLVDDWRAMTRFFWWFELILFGHDPFYYHIINLFTHILNSFIIFILIKKLSNNSWAGLFGAFFFATNKALITPVAWVSASIDQKLVLFFIPALLFYIKARKEKKFALLYFSLTYFFYFLTLKSKLMGVTLPSIFILYEIIYYLPKINIKEIILCTNRIIKIQSPIWIILALYAYGHYFNLPPKNDEYGVTLEVSHYFESLCWYIDHSLYSLLPEIQTILLLTTIIFLSMLLLKSKLILLGILWFMITLFPVAILTKHHFDHHLYLPLVGLSMIVGGLFNGVFSSYHYFRKSGAIIIILLFILFLKIDQPYFDSYTNDTLSQWKKSERTMYDLKKFYSIALEKEIEFYVYPRPGGAILNFNYTLRMVFLKTKYNHIIVVFETKEEFEKEIEKNRIGNESFNLKEKIFLQYDPHTGSLAIAN